MAFQPAPDCARVVLHMNSGDVFASNTFHFAMPGFDDNDLDAIAAHLDTSFIDDFMSPLSENVNCTGYTLYDIRTAEGSRIVHTFGTPVAGEQVGETPSNFIGAAVLSYYASGRGKSNQGRLYIAGVSENDADERRVQDSTMTALRDALTALITTPPPGWTWVVLSRYKDNVKRATATYSPVVRVVARTGIWGSQKRRVKRG